MNFQNFKLNYLSDLESIQLKLSDSGLRMFISLLDQNLSSNLLAIHLSNFVKDGETSKSTITYLIR